VFSAKINSKTFYSTKSKQIHGIKTVPIQSIVYVFSAPISDSLYCINGVSGLHILIQIGALVDILASMNYGLIKKFFPRI